MAVYKGCLSCFNKLRVHSFLCGLVDHEKGVTFISLLHWLLTIISLGLEFVSFSLMLVYWQVMSFVVHTGLYYAVKRKKLEYFLPWLVVIVHFILIGPFVMVWKYYEHIDEDGEEWYAIFIVAAGYPWWCITVYFFVVVMSLYQRYSDPKDPVSPDFGKRMKKQGGKVIVGISNESPLENPEIDLERQTDMEKV